MKVLKLAPVTGPPAGRALVAWMCLPAPFYPVPLSRCPRRHAWHIAGKLRSKTKSSPSPLIKQSTSKGRMLP
jgi:hypothetical protein